MHLADEHLVGQGLELRDQAWIDGTKCRVRWNSLAIDGGRLGRPGDNSLRPGSGLAHGFFTQRGQRSGCSMPIPNSAIPSTRARPAHYASR